MPVFTEFVCAGAVGGNRVLPICLYWALQCSNRACGKQTGSGRCLREVPEEIGPGRRFYRGAKNKWIRWEISTIDYVVKRVYDMHRDGG